MFHLSEADSTTPAIVSDSGVRDDSTLAVDVGDGSGGAPGAPQRGMSSLQDRDRPVHRALAENSHSLSRGFGGQEAMA